MKHNSTTRTWQATAVACAAVLALLATGARAEDWQPLWSGGNSLSQGRSGVSGAAVGTKVLFAGGQNASGSSAAVDIYDTANKTWSTASLSQARGNIAAVGVGTKVVFAGGMTASGSISAAVDIYDTANNTWSTASLSVGRDYITAATVGTKALFAGGWTAMGVSAVTNVVDIYDAANNTWSTARMSVARRNAAVAVAGTKALFAGGGLRNSAPATNLVEVYDAANNTWSTARLSQARRDISAATVGTKVLFAGGQYGRYENIPSAAVDIFDTANNTWSAASLSEARYYIAGASVGTKALFAGGSLSGSMSDVVDIYDRANNTWNTASLSVGRYNILSASVGPKAVFVGGHVTGVEDCDAVDIYDAANNTWRVESRSMALLDSAAAAVGNHALFAGGSWKDSANNVHYETIVDIFRSQNYVAVTSVKNFTLSDTTVVAGRLAQNGGALSLGNYDLAVGSMSGTAPIALGARTLTVGGDNTSADYAGAISSASGDGLLVKIGTGTQTLSSGANTLGPVTINQGVLSLASGLYLAGGGVNIAGGAGMSAVGALNRSLTNNGTLTGPSGANWLSLGGDVSGTGVYAGNVKFAHEFKPGNGGPAHVDLANVAFDAANTLELNVNGATAGSQYDQLHVSGTATLGGTLRLNLGGFTPSAGQTFTLLTGPMFGRFDTLVGVPAGWGIEYAAGGVTLKQLPTVSSVAVTPTSASVPVSGTQAFTALALDAAGNVLGVQPSFAWSVSGGGTIDSAGLFTAGGSAGGPHTVTPSAGGVSGTGRVWVTAAGSQAPYVATAAAANPNPVTAKTASLSVLGADDGGEAALTYTWVTAGTPPAAVTFSANGNNNAKNTTATFAKAGVYNLQARIQDAGGALALASLTVTVSQKPSGLTVLPPNPSVKPSAACQFAASLVDQFGDPIASAMTFAWSVSGGGTINQGGLFTAGGSAGGPYTVTAGLSANTGVTVAGTASAYEQWKQTQFTPEQLADPLISGDAADPDHDGMNNLQEFTAGTIPTNYGSVLAVTALAGIAGQQMGLKWSSVAGRTYGIQKSTNLTEGFPLTEASGIGATPPTNSYAVTLGSGGSGFYRVKVE